MSRQRWKALYCDNVLKIYTQAESESSTMAMRSLNFHTPNVFNENIFSKCTHASQIKTNHSLAAFYWFQCFFTLRLVFSLSFSLSVLVYDIQIFFHQDCLECLKCLRSEYDTKSSRTIVRDKFFVYVLWIGARTYLVAGSRRITLLCIMIEFFHFVSFVGIK